ESLLGHEFAMHPGGKGGNQAVAAACQGARTAIVARLGNDLFGQQLGAALVEKGVDVSLVQLEDDCPTGVSPVLMGVNGEYASIIVPSAGRMLSAKLPDDA